MQQHWLQLQLHTLPHVKQYWRKLDWKRRGRWRFIHLEVSVQDRRTNKLTSRSGEQVQDSSGGGSYGSVSG